MYTMWSIACGFIIAEIENGERGTQYGCLSGRWSISFFSISWRIIAKNTSKYAFAADARYTLRIYICIVCEKIHLRYLRAVPCRAVYTQIYTFFRWTGAHVRFCEYFHLEYSRAERVYYVAARMWAAGFQFAKVACLCKSKAQFLREKVRKENMFFFHFDFVARMLVSIENLKWLSNGCHCHTDKDRIQWMALMLSRRPKASAREWHTIPMRNTSIGRRSNFERKITIRARIPIRRFQFRKTYRHITVLNCNRSV